MASGAPSANGAAVGAMLESAAQRQREQAELMQLLKAALTNPSASTRYRVSLVGLGWEGEHPLVLVALPTGERLEIPLSDGEVRGIRQELERGPVPVDELPESHHMKGAARGNGSTS